MSSSEHLHIGGLVFPGIDQLDFTGPFEVLSRLPDSTFHVLWKDRTAVRDVKGLLLTPDMTFAEAPRLDVLLVPGGYGQVELMEDEVVLSFLRQQAATAKLILSVCTGALLCGGAGLLQGVQATTHWTAFHLLSYYGAVPVDARVVVDGKLVTAAGVTSGIDGALRAAAILRGERVAEEIQLQMQYAPEPPFTSGTPTTATNEVLESVRGTADGITQKRLEAAKRFTSKDSPSY